ncbi:peptidase family M20/M25/M40 [Candidatus Symbiothrix dinenymphae]|nr:peptidase family M20/M25/M40 [Candidatus Symbiothrix dinenymphae]
MKIKDLHPAEVWSLFDKITAVPRPSKKEGKIVAFLLDFAQEHGLEAEKDAADNVIIRKPATVGFDKRKTVILQSHVDMVCEKNSMTFDFENDPIQTYVEDGWVKARGTTLGADDGIGMAAALAILTAKDIEHGPINALFTTDEETGLNGANNIKPEFLKGDILLNLDSEEWGEFCIGCAGGKHTRGTFTYRWEPAPSKYFWFELKVSGLTGGHSGSDIHRELGNANKILARYLYKLMRNEQIFIADIDGGNLHNAIAREAQAIVGVPVAFKDKAVALLNILQTELIAELPAEDRELQLQINTVHTPPQVIDKKATRDLIYALYALPHGAISWNQDIPGMVETSTNLASIKMRENQKIVVTTSQRSASSSAKEDLVTRMGIIFRLASAEEQTTEGYPGWKPDPESEILKIGKKYYKTLYGDDPKIISIHAGLECGLFKEKNPLLDMMSCGPTILGAHSPEERLEIATVSKWWDLLKAILKNIPLAANPEPPNKKTQKTLAR